jgi:molybdenum cofactor cytidylyltransferase
MKFAEFALQEAEGAILAHSVETRTGRLRKGRRLDAGDLAAIAETGATSVVAARLEAGDVPEDEAARRIAVGLGGALTTVAAPFTGRANLFATAAGILSVDVGRIARVNEIDEAVTVATLPAHARVAAADMIATVKIIPFAVPGSVLARVETALAGGGALSVSAFRATGAGLILTRLPITSDAILEKRRKVMAARLEAVGGHVAAVETVPHAPGEIAAAIRRQAGLGLDPILVFAASAIVDRADVVPAGLVLAGGSVDRVGMPVDPGNLMMLGTLETRRVIGVPSCAASPKLNGFDWVLERISAGLDVGSADIAAMGVGGLLKEIPTRPQPRAGTQPVSSARRAPRIATVVLAAGRSSRMGTADAPRNKLVELLAAKPLVRHVVEAAIASAASSPVVVVLGHDGARVREALSGLDVVFAQNPNFAEGMAGSLQAGIARLPEDIDGVVVALGDMPEVTSDHISRLVSAFDPEEGRTIIVPMRERKRGNPVLWGASHLPAMMQLRGDAGARSIIAAHPDQVVEVEFDSDAVLSDIDTPDALASARARHGARG